MQFHATAFGHISIEELAELRETGRADQIKQARSVMAGSEPDWLPDAVTAEMHSTIKIQRSMVIMNSSEYQQHFKKKPPGSRGPKIPQLTVPREGYPSESEKVFCFTDPQQPHRTAHVSTQLVDKKITHRMQHDKNFFESQGREVFEFGCQAHQEEVSNGWLAKPIILPGIHEHMAKVNPEQAEAEHHHHHQLHDSQLSMDTTEGTDDVAVSPPLVASGVVNQVAVGNLLRRSVVSPGSLQPPQSSPKTDKKKTPQHGSPSEPGLRKLGSASEIDPCDSVSQVGSGIDDMRDMEMKNKSSSDKLKILKSRMPLKDIMEGVKLGRQERNARLFLNSEKLDPADTKLLRAYFKLVSHFVLVSWHSCTPALLHSCTPALLHSCTPAFLHSCTPALPTPALLHSAFLHFLQLCIPAFCIPAPLHSCLSASLLVCISASLHSDTSQPDQSQPDPSIA